MPELKVKPSEVTDDAIEIVHLTCKCWAKMAWNKRWRLDDCDEKQYQHECPNGHRRWVPAVYPYGRLKQN